jgi:anti-sigma regulatory factor (Ser/Thr protein kinase)
MPDQPDAAGLPLLKLQSANPAEAKTLFIEGFRQFAGQEHWDTRVSNEIELILEEWLTNVVQYGLAGVASPSLSFELKANKREAILRLSDNGKPFDPVRHPEPDLTVPVEHRPIGGMGIFMIKKLSDELTHERTGGLNILKVRKSLADPVLGQGLK